MDDGLDAAGDVDEGALRGLAQVLLGDDGVVVGDRPDTDGRLARALGWRFALVWSGVTSSRGPAPDPAPDVVAADLAELVADPVMRSLRSLVVPYRTLLAVCEGPAVLHRVRALQIRLSRSPPPHAEVVTRGEALPAVRELTLTHGGKHGGLDLTWLDDTPLMSRLERLAVVTAFDALGALQLGLELLELPAGTRNGEEPYEDCAAREIREETGMEAGRLQ